MNEELKIILDEMCSRVGAKDIDFEENEWYLKYSWTEEEQEDFRKWLADFFYNNSKVRRVFHIIKSKRECNKASGMFILNYGWRTK